MPLLLHLDFELAANLLQQALRPAIRSRETLLDDHGLLNHDLLADRRLVEGQNILELLLGELGGIDLRRLVQRLGKPRRVFELQLRGNLVEIPGERGVELQIDAFGPLDDARPDRIKAGAGALGDDDLLRQRDRNHGWRRLRGAFARARHGDKRERDKRGADRSGKEAHGHAPVSISVTSLRISLTPAPRSFRWSMILSDLPSRTEAFKSNDKPQQGFAQAGNRYPP